MVEMIFSKTQHGRDFVKVVSDEAVLIDEIAANAFDGDEPIYCELGNENGFSTVTVFDVSEAEFDAIYKAARAYVDSLYCQMAQAEAESEFPNW